MLDPSSIFRTFWTTLLDWSAALNTHGTGGFYQAWLLRRLGVNLKGPVAVARGTSFIGPGNLRLGRYVTFGANTRIVSWAGVEIGDDFMASDLLNINDGNHDPVTLRPQLARIRIGDRVWCGTNVTICAGVEIGDDVVIGAGSVVVRSIPSNTIAAGVPARAIRPLERGDRKLWSMWPERSCDHDLESAPPLRRRLHWLRARF